MQGEIKDMYTIFLMIILLSIPNTASSQLAPADPQATFTQATEALKSGDMKTATDQLRLSANRGHAQAQMLLGMLYLNGQGVPEDAIESCRWFNLAAKQGVKDAKASIQSIIINAAADGNVQILKELKVQGISLNTADEDGWSPLMIAAIRGHVEIAKALIEAGVNINKTDNKGNSPLIIATASGNQELVRELLNHGAKKDHKNKDGLTASDVALHKGFKEVSILLKQDRTPGTVFSLKAIIDDPDGYTNVRKERSASSDIVAKVNGGEQFFTYHQNGNWWQIKTRDGQIGYMHVSRIKIVSDK